MDMPSRNGEGGMENINRMEVVIGRGTLMSCSYPE